MKYTLEVWDDSNKKNPDILNTYEFDTLEEAKEFAQKLVSADEEKGLDYAYFITDEDGEEVYDIWEEE